MVYVVHLDRIVIDGGKRRALVLLDKGARTRVQ